MAKNSNLRNAAAAKQDEFYTMLTDIEKEMSHYKDFFKGKVVYCNCDDARESNFFKYFSKNFEFLGLKKLITTGYKAEGKGVVLIYEGDKNGNRKVDEDEVEVKELQGNGDFRSAECIEFLKEADVVVTNPPFSLFREYVAQLMEYGKKFIIIGNKNAIVCKEIFPYIKNNQLWMGCTITSGDREFLIPEHYETHSPSLRVDENGNRYLRVPGVCWFTNISNELRTTPLDLYKKYSNEYQKYDNFDAIKIDKTCDIPMDYDGEMGVPITFLFKYCPEQFEILDLINRYMIYDYFGVNETVRKNHSHCSNVNGKTAYARILIRKRTA